MASPSKNHRDIGDFFPRVGSHPDSPEQEQPGLPENLPSRNLTPRGLRFNNLDDALRNITGRSVSNTTSRKTSSAADTTISEDIPLRSMNRSSSIGVKSDTMLQGLKPSPPAHLLGRSLTETPAASGATTSYGHGRSKHTASPDSSFMPTGNEKPRSESLVPSDATGNTVDRIYAQYQFGTPHIPSSEFDFQLERSDTPLDYKTQDAHSPSRDHPTSTQVSNGPMSDLKANAPIAGHSSDVAPQINASTKPRSQLLFALTGRYTPEPVRGAKPASGLVFPKVLESLAAQDIASDNQSGMFPVPLRVQSIRARGDGTDRGSGRANSNGEFTSDSDEDPFKYDKQSYTVFLKPSKEREVSAALCRASGISRHSQGTMCSPDGSPLKTSPPPLPCLDAALLHLNGSPTRPSRQAKEGTPEFFEASALSSPLRRRSNPNVVKIELNKPLISVVDDPHALNEENLGLSGFQTPQQGRQVSEADEWETVVTDGREPGSRRVTLSSRRLPGPGPFKPTGSSIADVSDTASWSQGPPDEFGSTDRILQHPSNGEDSQRFKLRHLKGSHMPVFIPKQRVHRVNGLAQDSSRLFTDTTGPSSMATTTSNGLTSRLTDSLQNFHARNKQRLASLRPRMPQSDLEQGRGDPIRYNGMQVPASSIEQSPYSDDTAVYEMNRSNFRRSSLSTISNQSHGFAFNLISLPEAARIQAVRRASGQEDQSEVGLQRELATFNNNNNNNTKSFYLDGQRSGQTNIPTFPNSAYCPQRLNPILSSQISQDRNHFTTGNHRASNISTFSSIRSSVPSRPYSYIEPLDGNMEPRRRIFDGPSRLIPLEERRRLQNLDPELRAIAMRGGFFGNIPVDLDAFLSEETIARRRTWFVFVALLSIFPFFSVLAWMGKFDEGLSWYTGGEVHALSQPQKRILTGILIAHCIILPALSVFLVVYYAFPALRD